MSPTRWATSRRRSTTPPVKLSRRRTHSATVPVKGIEESEKPLDQAELDSVRNTMPKKDFDRTWKAIQSGLFDEESNATGAVAQYWWTPALSMTFFNDPMPRIPSFLPERIAPLLVHFGSFQNSDVNAATP